MFASIMATLPLDYSLPPAAVVSSIQYSLYLIFQGIIKIFVNKTESESSDVSLLVTLSTTAVEITRTVLEKLELVEDPNCYHLVQAHTSKSSKAPVIFYARCGLEDI